MKRREHAVRNPEKLLVRIDDWLRKNAKEVKGFEVDVIFTGNIKTFERSYEKEGTKHSVITRRFKNFEELKKYYGKSFIQRIKKFVNRA